MTDRLVVCERCDERHSLGGNPEARLKFLIANGWHHEPRGKDYCAKCWRTMQMERKPAGLI
jgi:hypothetical protein